MHSKKQYATKRMGFTLIELLVVIAIIAILAAILFPVFASARAKARQATCQSNLKQIGLSMNMYSQDYDETLPIAQWYYSYSYSWGGWSISGGYFENVSYTLPPGAATGPEASFWIQALVPYVKNNNIWACPSIVSQYEVYSPDYNYTYNGLLDKAPLASIVTPASAPLMWEGLGNYTFGEPVSTPYLSCYTATNPNQCVYVPSAPGCSSNTPGATSYMYGNYGGYVHGQGLNILFDDGHVKIRELGPFGTDYYNYSGAPKTDIKTQPWYSYGSTGYTYYPNLDVNGCHANMFRPDFDPAQ